MDRQISVSSVLKSPGTPRVPLRAAYPHRSSGTPLDTLLVGLDEGICPGQASVLTVLQFALVLSAIHYKYE